MSPSHMAGVLGGLWWPKHTFHSKPIEDKCVTVIVVE